MFRKLNTKLLISVFLVLLIIVLVMKLLDNPKNQNTFKTDLITVDTAAVSKITIYPKSNKDKELSLQKNGTSWDLISDGKTYPADENSIKGMLSELVNMKPLRVAGMKKDSWEKYELTDTNSVRVKVEGGNNLLCDFRIGKFSYQQPKNQWQRQMDMTTYVRVADDEKVYAINGFLSMTFNPNINSLRNKTLISGTPDNWTKLTYTYPGDSSFTLTKENNNWTVNGITADSTKVKNYLNTLSRTMSSTYADNASLTIPSHTLKIEGQNMSPVELKAFPADSVNVLLTSSLNPKSVFNDSKKNIFNRVFVKKENFLPTIP